MHISSDDSAREHTWRARKTRPVIALYVLAVFIGFMALAYFGFHSREAVRALFLAAIGALASLAPGILTGFEYRLTDSQEPALLRPDQFEAHPAILGVDDQGPAALPFEDVDAHGPFAALDLHGPGPPPFLPGDHELHLSPVPPEVPRHHLAKEGLRRAFHGHVPKEVQTCLGIHAHQAAVVLHASHGLRRPYRRGQIDPLG